MQRLALGSALACLLGLAAPAAAQETLAAPAPLLLDGETSLDFPPDPSFDVPNGTLELWLAALWQQDPGYAPCILALRDVPTGDSEEALRRATRYSLHVSGARDEIILWNGSEWGSLEFDLADEDLHHLVFVTREGETQVFGDGESLGVMELGYGSATGLPLHVGSSDGVSEPFVGALWALRIWDAPLSREELGRVVDALGPPEDDALAERLVAWSAFTPDGSQLLLRADDDPDDAPSPGPPAAPPLPARERPVDTPGGSSPEEPS